MTDRLDVHLFGRLAGNLRIAGEVRAPEDWQFSYAEGYRGSSHATPLSVSLPVREAAWHGAVVRNWFGNLLPEGPVREAIAARLRIPVWDDFALLAAIGGECAGAVSIVAETRVPVPTQQSAENLEQALAQLGQPPGEGAWALLGSPLRLSLAGAQDKLAVVRDPDGKMHLPRHGELSTHILKPDSLRIPGLRDLEALGLNLASAVGLSAVTAQPVQIAGQAALLVERYDREPAADAGTQRLHQEDFCQALGHPSELKYQGLTLADCSRLIRQTLRLGPGAVQAFLDWVIFNAIIGNADAHGKNLALLCDQTGHRRLAPFYDLVPTIAISERLVERKPALDIGGAARIDAIRTDNWNQFARAAGYAPGFVLTRVVDLACAAEEQLDTVAKSLLGKGASQPVIERAVTAIRPNARTLQTANRMR